MKLSIFSTATLALAVAAVPHRRHLHQHVNRRDVVVDVVTDVQTTTAPAAVVYVNQAGEPQWTSYKGHGHKPHWPTAGQSTNSQPALTTTTAAAPSDTSVPESSAAPSATESSQTSAGSAPSSYPSTSSASAAPAPSSSAPSGGSGTSAWGYGLSYSPYDSNSNCKTQSQVNEDINSLSGYGMIRIYGVDCNQASTVLSAANSKGMKIFAGIYDITQVESETQTLIDAAKGNWDAVDTVSIGNEAVNNGAAVSDVVSAVKTARSLLQAAGYNGKVVTVDVFSVIIANPELCQVSDFAAANCHAFFDADITADNAGQYVAQQAAQVKKACGGMDTVITESGWPSQGEANGAAVPSEANQKAAISSLRSAFSDNIILFSAYNDLWKTNTAATFDAEQYWGIYGMAPSS